MIRFSHHSVFNLSSSKSVAPFVLFPPIISLSLSLSLSSLTLSPMDHPSEEEEDHIPQNGRRSFTHRIQFQLRFPIRRCFLTFASSILASFLLSFLVGIAALAVGHRQAASVSVPATCKILSSRVEIRNSKVCELGLLGYKAKHLKTAVQCRDDYYWASVFQVEYKEYFSGQTYQSVADAPKEALPYFCRPDFGAAYLTRLKFKVNETYNCRYTLGNWKADIYSDNNNLFNCQAEQPSILELIRRVSIWFVQSYISEKFITAELLVYAFGGAVSGISAGFFAAAFVTVFLNGARRFFYKKQRLRALADRLKCICLLTLYLSAIGWFTLRYTQFIGLKQLVLESRLKHWIF